MATTANTAKTTETKPKRAPVDLITRIKKQLTTACLQAKLSTADVEALNAHLTKLKGLME